MRDYSQYKKCQYCGGYDMPDEDCVYERNGITWYDRSMQCDGIQTWGPDPFAEEIHGDFSDYLMCDGGRYQSSMDI
jgi:hypothetical protein